MSCYKCGNSGWNLDGTPCSCNNAPKQLTKHMFIPAAMQKVQFSSSFVPTGFEVYGHFMETVCKHISTKHNISESLYVCAPNGVGKSTFVYSCMTSLIRAGQPVYPYIDNREVMRICNNIDNGKTDKIISALEVEPEAIYTVPVLFIRMIGADNQAHRAMASLLNRRMRMGYNTIMLSHIPFLQLVRNDFDGTLRSMKGDGSFGTFLVKEWGSVTDAS